MKKNNSFYPNHSFWVVWVITILGFSQCKRNEPDPCAGPFKANFKMEVKLNDTIIAPEEFIQTNYIQFTASEDYESYEWKIGTDDRVWTGKSFGLYFWNDYGEFQVTLKARKKASLLCDPEDDGIDVVSKTLKVRPYNYYPIATPLPFLGKFEGYHIDEPNKVFTLQIVDLTDVFDINGFQGVRIFNLPPGCGGSEPSRNSYSPTVLDRTYKYFRFESIPDEKFCLRTAKDGFGELKSGNPDTLILNYQIAQGKAKKFIGTRKP
jgi:hypothetical protein